MPVHELENHLAKYLEYAKKGKDVMVTVQGKPVAKLCRITGVFQNGASPLQPFEELAWIRESRGGKPVGLGGLKRIKLKDPA